MDAYIKEFVSILGGGSALVLALAWLVKKLVAQYLSKDVETFKSSLKAQTDIEIERLKASLQLEGYRDQVRFSNLHEKQAETIASLYEQLLSITQHLESCASLTKSDVDFSEFASKEINKALSEYVDAKRAFRAHEIYFEPELCTLLDDFFVLLNDAIKHTSAFDKDWKKRKGDSFLATWEQVTNKLPVVLDALRTQFRRILGVSLINEKLK